MKYGKIIGSGSTATVYEWGEGTVLKLFVKGYPRSSIEREFNNAKAINDQNFAKPKVYELISYEEQLGIIYDKVEGETLCHGDFHPGNILLSNGLTMFIDFMNVCHGDPLYDVARTVFLVEYTPVPQDTEDREKLLQYKKTLADLYLVEMNVTREMIQDYLAVITVARVSECPEEYL